MCVYNHCIIGKYGYLLGFIIQVGNDMAVVMHRLETLENSQKATVVSALEDLQHFIKTPMFNKEKALDYLINLKIVAKELNHPRSGFFNAVLQAMQDNIRVSDSQFQQYLQALLGDKDNEKVLDSIAKVDKAMRAAAPRPFLARGHGCGDRSSVNALLATSLGTTKVIALFGNPGVRRREEGLVQGCRSNRGCDVG